jgi:hypothetical protein
MPVFLPSVFSQVIIMLKHFVLNLNPAAKFEWERSTLHNPITAEQPTLATLVAEAIGGELGSYLVAVTLEVKVLDRVIVDGLSARSRLSVGLSDEPLSCEDRALLSDRSERLLPELAA